MPSICHVVSRARGWSRHPSWTTLSEETWTDDNRRLSLPDSQATAQPESALRTPRPRGAAPCGCLDAQSLSSDDTSLGAVKVALFVLLWRRGLRPSAVSLHILVALGCVLLLLLACLVPVVLGVCAITLVDPPPVIDKSIKAFQIPNHAASRQQDALNKAADDMRQYLTWYNTNRTAAGRRRRRHALPGPHYHRLLAESLAPSILDHPKAAPWTVQAGPPQPGADRLPLQRFPGGRSRRQAQPASRFVRITQAQRSGKLELVFLARGVDEPGDLDSPNVFTRRRLAEIHAMEQLVLSHAGFRDHCYIDYSRWAMNPSLAAIGGCAPLNSLLTYFYPSVAADSAVHYDGLGHVLDDVNKSLSLAMTHASFYWYVDARISATYRRSHLLRAELHFGLPLPGYLSSSEDRNVQKDRLKKFIVSYIEPLSQASTDHVRVLYGGNDLFDHMVESVFWSDLTLALVSLAAIVLCMFVLTSFSAWLTLCGVLAIILSFPTAIFVYRVFFQRDLLGILNGVAAFVIIGIGVDDVFVFVNTFRQCDPRQSARDRLRYTVWEAGKATFFTSATTAAAFAANVASSIPAVHDFGLFMSIIVVCCWLLVLWIMPPALYLWHLACAGCERLCYHKCVQAAAGRTCGLKLPADMAQIRVTSSTEESVTSYSTAHPEKPPIVDDFSALDGGHVTYLGALKEFLQPEPGYLDDGEYRVEEQDEEAWPCGGDEEPVCYGGGEGCGFVTTLQAATYRYIATPVIKARWFILGGYVLLLAGSVALMTQIRVASKPPQLFREGSNLQVLMDLTANFSDSAVSCDLCSGFYTERSRQLPTIPTSLPPARTPGPPLPPATQPLPYKPTTTPTTTIPTTRTTPTTPHTPWPSSAISPDTLPASQLPSPPSTPPSEISTDGVGPPTPGETPTPTQPSGGKTSAATEAPPTTPAPLPSTPAPPVTPLSKVSPPTTRTTAPQASTPQPTTLPSVAPNYDACAQDRCEDVQSRPHLEFGAGIHIVFGIRDIDRTGLTPGAVLTQKGKVVYDENFAKHFSLLNLDVGAVRDLCRLCKVIASNTRLVQPNSTQCVPEYMFTGGTGLPLELTRYFFQLPECQGLPRNQRVNGKWLPTRAMAGYVLPGNPNQQPGFTWIAFAVGSTTYKGQSYFEAYKHYQEWEAFMDTLRTRELPADSPLRNMYQTSEFWTQVMMEVVAVSSAIYGLVFSLVICVALVAIFTGHVILLIIVVVTILGVVCLVVGAFYLAGWEMGAVEAVSLSILVGSSVDYCVHLVEGFLVAAGQQPRHVTQSDAETRRWRTKSAISHVGVSIISSALTTVMAAVPLTQTAIVPFSRFGQIVAINTTVSIVYTLTICAALLSLCGPARYSRSPRSVATALAVTAGLVGACVLALYTCARFGVHIPGPNGEDLFPVPE